MSDRLKLLDANRRITELEKQNRDLERQLTIAHDMELWEIKRREKVEEELGKLRIRNARRQAREGKRGD